MACSCPSASTEYAEQPLTWMPVQVLARDILFYGLRVRMCVASGLCEQTKVCLKLHPGL